MRAHRVVVLVLAAAFLATACAAPAAPAAPAPAAPAPVAAATCRQTSIRLAVPVTPPNVVHLPAFIAFDLGYFKAENLDVEFQRFEGGVGAMRSLAAGGADVAGTSSEPAIAGISQGADVRIVTTYSPVLSVAFAVNTNTVKTFGDLKGKKIGIQEPNGFADQLSRAVLKKAGIDPKEVQFVTTTTAGRVPQLIQGATDTAVLHVDQVLATAKTAPHVQILANMWEVLPEYQYAVWAMPNIYLKNYPNIAECIVRALVKGNRVMYEKNLRKQLLELAVKHTKGDPAVIEQAYDILYNAKAWPQNEGLPKTHIEGTIKSLKDTNQLAKDVKFEDLVDLSVVQRVVQQLGRKDFPY